MRGYLKSQTQTSRKIAAGLREIIIRPDIFAAPNVAVSVTVGLVSRAGQIVCTQTDTHFPENTVAEFVSQLQVLSEISVQFPVFVLRIVQILLAYIFS